MNPEVKKNKIAFASHFLESLEKKTGQLYPWIVKIGAGLFDLIWEILFSKVFEYSL